MLGILWDIFLYLLMFGGIFTLLIGIVTVASWMMPIKAPADQSNRINRIRLWHWCVAAPHRFLANFSWMGGDEVDNLKEGRVWEKGGND